MFNERQFTSPQYDIPFSHLQQQQQRLASQQQQQQRRSPHHRRHLDPPPSSPDYDEATPNVSGGFPPRYITNLIFHLYFWKKIAGQFICFT